MEARPDETETLREDTSARIPRLALLLGALALGATLASCTFVGNLLHGTRDRIIFSHHGHLDLAVVKSDHAVQTKMCASCHFATPDDIRGEEPIQPLEAQCLTCHGDWKKTNQCGKCHTDPETPLTYAKPEKPRIFYSHARHRERLARVEVAAAEKAAKLKEPPGEAGLACSACHEDAWKQGPDPAEVDLAQDPLDRQHQKCFQCHLMRTEWDRMACGKCHEHLSDREGLRPLSRFRHEGNWLEHHGDELIGRPVGLALCVRCHDRHFCQDCHQERDVRGIRPELRWPDRPDRAFIHRGDYINRHAFEARTAPADCIRCHAVAGFCRDCHDVRGLTTGSRPTDPNQDPTINRNRYLQQGGPSVPILQYHNGTYSEFVINPSSPLHHGRTARRDAVLCASCHDYGSRSICIDCHAVPTVKAPRVNGGNPHPVGFKSKIPKSSRPCSYCHVYAGGG